MRKIYYSTRIKFFVFWVIKKKKVLSQDKCKRPLSLEGGLEKRQPTVQCSAESKCTLQWWQQRRGGRGKSGCRGGIGICDFHEPQRHHTSVVDRAVIPRDRSQQLTSLHVQGRVKDTVGHANKIVQLIARLFSRSIQDPIFRSCKTLFQYFW